MLHAAPFAARQILSHFADPIRLNTQAIQIVDDYISPRALAQHSSIAETGRMCGQGREAVVRLFERHPLLVPNHPAEKVGSEGATGEELRMRAAVGNAGEGVHRSVDDLSVELRVELRLGLEEFSLQVSGERQIDHHINRVPTFFLADLTE